MALSGDTILALKYGLRNSSAAEELATLADTVDELTATEIGYVDAVTPGTAAASKAVILNSSSAITSGLNTLYFDAITTGTTDNIRVGAFASTADGSGSVLSSTKTASVRVYSDDGGVALGVAGSVSDLKGFLSRVLVTEDTTGYPIRLFGAMGQIKGYSATGDLGIWNNEVVAGVYGYTEIVRASGTATYGGYGVTAGTLGVIATQGTITVNTTHVFAGVASISQMRTGVTQTGKTCAFYAGIYDATNWSTADERAKWGYGLFVHPDSCTRGVSVGTLGSNITSGLPIGGATALNGFYADDSGAAQTASTVWRNLEARTYFTIDQTNASSDFYSIRGQIKAATGIDFSGDASVKACVQGYLECAGATQCGTGAFLSAVHGEIWVDGNFNNSGGGLAAGVMSRIYASTGTVGGATAAFMASKQWASTQVWPYGLYLQASACTTGVYMSTVTTAFTVTGALTQLFDFTGATTAVVEDNKVYDTKAGSIKILMPSGGAAYINIYDGTPG